MRTRIMGVVAGALRSAGDAGGEFNDELCSSLPGTHGMADLNRVSYDWRNPVAIVTVTRVK